MISMWHLFWIVPISAWFGFAICAIISVGRASDKTDEEA